MKNKGLLIAIAVIGVTALIMASVAVGIFWGRGRFGGGCFRGLGLRNNSAGFGRGMMWDGGSRDFWPRDSSSSQLLSIEESEKAVNDYIADYESSEELHIKEIMLFDNHAYAEVGERDTGIGAFELLVDPVTLDVYLEQGASMMWNIKYGPMQGGMMGGAYAGDGIDMPVNEEEAVSIANNYLARNDTALKADDHADQFYGYYTIHTLENNQVVGMLSVNGYSGQVILHNWHGELLEMSEHEDDSH